MRIFEAIMAGFSSVLDGRYVLIFPFRICGNKEN
jgi:hypothetical protein